MGKAMIRVGFDVGGSFTDFVVWLSGSGARAEYFKVPSTPHDPSEGIESGLREILEALSVDPSRLSFVGHGTTVATNMVIERKGVQLAMITTSGFRDVLEIGRQTRPHLYDYTVEKPSSLVSRDFRFEVDERIGASGEVVTPLDEDGVRRIAESLKNSNVKAVAICFLHSYRNAEHERRAGEILKELLPDVYLSLSSEVLPEFREFERFSTTAINAYVGPRMDLYLKRFLERLSEVGISAPPQTVHSNGGLMSVASVRSFPVRTCLSGPAAGVMGAARLAAAAGFDDIITFDVGGTSTDVSLVKAGQPALAQGRDLAGLPVKVPMIDIDTIGAGGGSIAWIDSASSLKVGPHSAGAAPGPVAYGLGGVRPTVTDANLVLGRLNPTGLLNGKLKIDIEAARRAIDEGIAKPLGISVEAAAEGIIEIAVSNMSRAIRSISTEKGHDPAEFSLFAFGGAGPLHAPAVAAETDMATVVVPLEPGTLCARGILLSDVSFDFVGSDLFRVDERSWSKVSAWYETLLAQGREWLEQEGVPSDTVQFEFSVDARYSGQNYEINISLNDHGDAHGFTQIFHDMHRQVHGYDIPKRAIECVNFRLKARGSERNQPPAEVQTARTPERAGSRQVYLDGAWTEVDVYRRGELPPGTALQGPVIVEEMSSTSIISAGQSGYVDEFFNLVIGARS